MGDKLWRGGRLCQRRRVVDRAAMRPDWDYVGKLALRRKVAGDVFVVGGYGADFFAGAFMRIEHDQWSFSFVSLQKKGKSRTFARLCTASPKLSGRLSTHQGVWRALYQTPLRGARGPRARSGLYQCATIIADGGRADG